MIPLTTILKQLHPDIAVYMSMGKHWTKKMLRLHHPGPWYLKGSMRDMFGYSLIFPDLESEVEWKFKNLDWSNDG